MSAEIKLSMNYRYMIINPDTRQIITTTDKLADALTFCRRADINPIIAL